MTTTTMIMMIRRCLLSAKVTRRAAASLSSVEAAVDPTTSTPGRPSARSSSSVALASPERSHTTNPLLFRRRRQGKPGAAAAPLSTAAGPTTVEYETLSDPAPGSPFHYAFPVHSLAEAKDFYGNVLGCQEGRSSERWQDYSLHGHQIVCHWVGEAYRCVDYYNPVDGDEVPVPHAGLALTVEQFQELAGRLRSHGVRFIIEPHLRFRGQPGEQYTMFFKDPSGNNLEFKAMTQPQNLFAKYNVAAH
jgi:extradiol dioxygenase family protein